MKSALIAGLALIAVLSSVNVQAGGRYHGYYGNHYYGHGHSYRYHHHRYRSSRKGAYLLGGIIIGSLLHSAYSDRSRQYYPRRVEHHYYGSSYRSRYRNSDDYSSYRRDYDYDSRYSYNDEDSYRDSDSRYSTEAPEIVEHRDDPLPVIEHVLLRDKEGRCYVIGKKENEQGETVEIRTEIEAEACEG